MEKSSGAYSGCLGFFRQAVSPATASQPIELPAGPRMTINFVFGAVRTFDPAYLPSIRIRVNNV